METLKPIEGQINWNADHMPTPLNYARYVDSVERVAESIELDDVLFVPVVRCKDCQHYKETDGLRRFNLAFCKFHSGPCEPDGFCAWGERKESGE